MVITQETIMIVLPGGEQSYLTKVKDAVCSDVKYCFLKITTWEIMLAELISFLLLIVISSLD